MFDITRERTQPMPDFERLDIETGNLFVGKCTLAGK